MSQRLTKVPYVHLDSETVTTARNSYAGIEALLYRQDGLWIPGRKVNNNTYLERRPEGIALRLHATDILLWGNTSTVHLDTGGWYTMTTKERINSWLPHRYELGTSKLNERYVQIYSDHGYWRVALSEDDNVCYHDGMIVDLKNRTEFSPSYDDTADREWNKEVDKRIAKWLRSAPVSFESPTPETMITNNQSSNPMTEWAERLLRLGKYPSSLLTFLTSNEYLTGQSPQSPAFKRTARKFFRSNLYRGSHMRAKTRTEDSPNKEAAWRAAWR